MRWNDQSFLIEGNICSRTSVQFNLSSSSTSDYEFYFIHSFIPLVWETTTAALRGKLQQWAQGCIYAHMHDVIEYRSNVCVCAFANKREKKRNHCCWMCMLEGLLYVNREEHSISSTYIHKKQLSFVFIFSLPLARSALACSSFDSFNHLSSTTMKLIWSEANRRAVSFYSQFYFPSFPLVLTWS